MSKNKFNKYKFFSSRVEKDIDNPAYYEKSMRQYYINKFFNLWMNKVDIDGLEYEQVEYIMRKFWDDGAVAGRSFEMHGERIRVFSTFAENDFDMYDHPIHVNMINVRGAPEKLVPATPLKVDEEVALIYAQPNRKGIGVIVSNCIDRMVEIDSIIKVNLAAAGIGLTFVTDEVNRDRLEDIESQILAHNRVVKVSADDVSKIVNLNAAVPFIGAQLRQERQAIENELLTFLGIDNAGISEKTERQTVDEVNANNDLININQSVIEDEIKKCFENFNKVFNDNLKVTFKNKPTKAVSEKLGGPKSVTDKKEGNE